MTNDNKIEEPKTQPQPSPAVNYPKQGMEIKTDIKDILSYLAAINSPNIFDARVPITIVPEQLKVVDLEKHLPVPKSIRKKINFVDYEGFDSYFQKYKIGYEPQIFFKSSNEGLDFKCIFDYDLSGSVVKNKETSDSPEVDVVTRTAQARWNEHEANLIMSYDRDYKTIREINGKWITQDMFAAFVELNLHLFQKPDSASMLEIAQELKGTNNASFRRGKKLANGEVQFEYVEEIDAKTVTNEIALPEYITLQSPIYEGFDKKELKAAFKFRIDKAGEILFSILLLSVLEEREAQEEVKTKIKGSTGLPVYQVSSFEGISAVRKN
jgi:uncharacterized protein YfdQ (DUF2303 family)